MRSLKKLLFIITLLLSFFVLGCDEEKNDEIILEEAFIEIVDDINISEVKEDIALPTTYENIKIVWESNKTNVISNEGVVNRQDEDVIVTLTATLTINEISKEFEISVRVVALEKPVTYAVILLREDNGNVEVSKLSDITAGETITIRVSANAGYELEWLKVNGEVITVINGEADVIVNSDIEIEVSFKEIVKPAPNTYTVTFDSNGGSQVNSITVNEGDLILEVPMELTKEGYTFLGWFVGDVQFDFNTPITSNITLTAKWQEKTTPVTYSITIPADANGQVTASKTTEINAGEQIILTITPNTGYELEWLKVNDVNINVVNGKAIITVNSNINIVVSFVEINQGDDDDTQTVTKYTSTFKDEKLSVGENELEYTASRDAFGWDTSGRGVQFTQSNGPVTLTSKVSLIGVNSVTVKVTSNNPTGMEVSIKVGNVSLSCNGEEKVTVNKNSGTVELTFTGNNLSGNVNVLLTNLTSKNSMYISSIAINGTSTDGSGSTDDSNTGGNTGTTEVTIEQKLINIKNDLSSVLNLANTKVVSNITFPSSSLYNSIIVWSTSDSSIIDLEGNVDTTLSEKTQVTIGYQIILDDVEYDFVYFNVYVGGKTTYISYYASVEGLSGSSLFSALRNIITSTHKKVTSYDSLKEYLQEADEDPNNSSNMILFYTGQSIKKTNNMNTWNREHVWPQSKGWFKTSGAGADMHHIRPCNPSVNGSRGSILFGESSSYYNAGNHGADYRGDCARIILYMFTRYSQADSYSWTSIFQSYEILYKWHTEDPVSETEVIRNDYTATIQGNRNPFIDYPEFASMIWNNKGTKLANELFTGTKADKLNAFAEDFGEEVYF